MRFSSQLQFVDVLGAVRNLQQEGDKLYVLETVTLVVKVTANADISAYNFRLVLNSAQTGIYWDKDRERRCDPNPTKATATTFREFKAADDLRSARATFAVIRCGLGAISNRGVQVEAQLKTDPARVTSITGANRVKQAPHRSFTTIHYKTNLQAPGGARPSYVPTGYYSETVATAGAHAGAGIWIGGMGETLFKPVSSGHHLIIQAAWKGSSADTCGYAQACIATNFGSDSHSQGVASVLILFPPAAHLIDGKPIQWTNSRDEAVRARRLGSHIYLPAVMAHELGHGFGVGETYYAPGVNVMNEYHRQRPQQVTSDNDEYGMREVRKPHH